MRPLGESRATCSAQVKTCTLRPARNRRVQERTRARARAPAHARASACDQNARPTRRKSNFVTVVVVVVFVAVHTKFFALQTHKYLINMDPHASSTKSQVGVAASAAAASSTTPVNSLASALSSSESASLTSMSTSPAPTTSAAALLSIAGENLATAVVDCGIRAANASLGEQSLARSAIEWLSLIFGSRQQQDPSQDHSVHQSPSVYNQTQVLKQQLLNETTTTSQIAYASRIQQLLLTGAGVARANEPEAAAAAASLSMSLNATLPDGLSMWASDANNTASSNNNNNNVYQLEALSEKYQVYVACVYTVTAIASLILNVVTLIVLNRYRHSSLRKYLINLCVSDLLMSLFSIRKSFVHSPGANAPTTTTTS